MRPYLPRGSASASTDGAADAQVKADCAIALNVQAGIDISVPGTQFLSTLVTDADALMHCSGSALHGLENDLEDINHFLKKLAWKKSWPLATDKIAINCNGQRFTDKMWWVEVHRLERALGNCMKYAYSTNIELGVCEILRALGKPCPRFPNAYFTCLAQQI